MAFRLSPSVCCVDRLINQSIHHSFILWVTRKRLLFGVQLQQGICHRSSLVGQLHYRPPFINDTLTFHPHELSHCHFFSNMFNFHNYFGLHFRVCLFNFHNCFGLHFWLVLNYLQLSASYYSELSHFTGKNSIKTFEQSTKHLDHIYYFSLQRPRIPSFHLHIGRREGRTCLTMGL